MSDRLEQIRLSLDNKLSSFHDDMHVAEDVEWLLDEVDRLREGRHRILWNSRDNNSIDEVVFRRPEMVHIEQMHETCWWIGVYLDGTDRYWMGNFTAKTSRSGLDFSEQEDAGVGWDDDDCHAEWEDPDHDLHA